MQVYLYIDNALFIEKNKALVIKIKNNFMYH